jgi:hypothetical protein
MDRAGVGQGHTTVEAVMPAEERTLTSGVLSTMVR